MNFIYWLITLPFRIIACFFGLPLWAGIALIAAIAALGIFFWLRG